MMRQRHSSEAGGAPHAADVHDLGLVPEEVLLLAGRPDAVASAFWTPWLASLSANEQASVVERARAGLLEDGLLTADGDAVGPLAEIATVVRSARCVVTFATQLHDGASTRGAFICSDEEVLLVVSVPEQAGHLVHLLTPEAAVAALATGLDPMACAAATSSAAVPRLPRGRRMSPATLAAQLPIADRASSVLLVRVEAAQQSAADGLDEPSEQLCTIIGSTAGLRLVAALPTGDVEVTALDDRDVVAVARLLLQPTGAGDEVRP